MRMVDAGRGRRRAHVAWVAGLVGALLALTLPLGMTTAGAADPDFTLVVAPDDQAVPPGGSTGFLVRLGALDSFNSPVTLSVGGLPAGVTGTFNPRTLTPTGSSILTITAGASAVLGPATLNVAGVGGGIS